MSAIGVFRTTHASEKDRISGLIQFGRALYELNVDIICANTPQAKGRVERANLTLQDRLAEELRLRGIDTIEAANAYAREFIADFNARFDKEPRTVSHRLTLRYDKVLFILEPADLAKSLAARRSSSAIVQTDVSRSHMRAPPCPIEPLTRCAPSIDRRSSATSA